MSQESTKTISLADNVNRAPPAAHSVKGKRQPNQETDVLVVGVTGKASTCVALARDVAQGLIGHATPTELNLVASRTKAVVYKTIEESLTYFFNLDLLGERSVLKLRYKTFSRTPGRAKASGFIAMIKGHLEGEDTATVGIYAAKSDGSPVTSADVQNGTCWFYIADEERTASLPLSTMKSSKGAPDYHVTVSTLKSFSHYSCLMGFDSDGNAIERTENRDYVVMPFPSINRFKSFFLRAAEAPQDTDECGIKLVKRAVHVTNPDKNAPGRYCVIVGINKKNVKNTFKAAQERKADTEEPKPHENVAKPSQVSEEEDGKEPMEQEQNLVGKILDTLSDSSSSSSEDEEEEIRAPVVVSEKTLSTTETTLNRKRASPSSTGASREVPAQKKRKTIPAPEDGGAVFTQFVRITEEKAFLEKETEHLRDTVTALCLVIERLRISCEDEAETIRKRYEGRVEETQTTYEAVLDQNEEEMATLRRKVDELTLISCGSSDEQKELLEEARTDNARLSTALETLNAVLKPERSDWERSLKAANASYNDLVEAYDSLKASSTTAEEESARTRSALEGVLVDMNLAEEESARTRSALEGVLVDMNLAEEECADLRKRPETTGTERDTLLKTVSTLDSKVDHLQGGNEDLTNEMEGRERTLKEALTDGSRHETGVLRDQVETPQQNVDSLEANVDAYRKANQTLQSELTDKTGKLSDGSTNAAGSETALRDARKVGNDHASGVDSLNLRVEDLETELISQATVLKGESNAVLQQTTRTVLNLTRDREVVQKDLKVVGTDLDVSSKLVEDLTATVEARETELEDASDRIKSLEREKTGLENDQRENEARAAESVQYVASLEEQVRGLKDTNQDVLRRHSDLMASSAVDGEEYEAKLRKATDALRKNRDSSKWTTDRAIAADTRVEQLVKELGEKKDKLKKQQTSSTATLNMLRATFEEEKQAVLEAHLKEVADQKEVHAAALKQQKQKYEKELADNAHEMEASQASLKQQYKSLTDGIKSMQEEHKLALEGLREEYKEKIENQYKRDEQTLTRCLMKKLTDAMLALERAEEEKSMALATQGSRHQSEIFYLQREIEKRDNEIRGLQDALLTDEDIDDLTATLGRMCVKSD